MAEIKSGESSNKLTIDPTSKAARVTIYDTSGNALYPRQTFRASTTNVVTVVSGTAPFFTFYGSGSKTIKILRIWYQAIISTTATNVIILVSKRSSAQSGGTPSTITTTPVDSNDSAATATAVQLYTAAPTAGSLVGTIETRRALINTNVSALANVDLIFDFRDYSNLLHQVLTLRGTSEGIDLSYAVAPGNTTDVTLAVEWTEE